MRWGPHYFPDQELADLYWFLRCVPSCRANALLVEIDRLEEHLRAEIAGLRRLIETAYREVEEAWEVIDG